MSREYRTTAWEALVTKALLLVIVLGSVWGLAVYAQDQADRATRDRARAEYLAAQSVYENVRDDVTRCEQRVESRVELRRMFLAVFDLLDDLRPTSGDFTLSGRQALDRLSPALSIADCPPAPIPPTQPEE